MAARGDTEIRLNHAKATIYSNKLQEKFRHPFSQPFSPPKMAGPDCLDLRPAYDRKPEHQADAILLLERLRQANREGIYPSTAELQAEGRYGLRPVNRLVDLRLGKYGKKFDVERINCGHGVYRWKLHEPNRTGYPKVKGQEVLPLDSRAGRVAWFEWEFGSRSAATKPAAPEFELTP